MIVLLAVGAGVLVPKLGTQLRPLITPLVIFLVYSSFRDTDSNSSTIGSYWELLLLFLLLSYGVLPVLGMYIVDLLLSGGTRTGFAIMLAAPTTAGSAIVWTRLSDGEVQFSTAASITSLFLAPVVTPILLGHLLSNSGGVPTLSILTNLAIILGGGALLHVGVPEGWVSKRAMDVSTSAAIMSLIYISISGSEISGISPRWFARVFAISTLLVALGALLVLLLKYALDLSYGEAVSLFFITNLKNLGITVSVSVTYTGPLVVTTIVFYYVFQQVISAMVSDL